MFIFAWAAEASLHACTHTITRQVTVNSVMASAATPLEQQIDIIGAWLGYQLHKEAIIAWYTSGKDTFVAVPTGYGKSLIYGCLPLVFDSVWGLVPGTSLALVVCPLKALMLKDSGNWASLLPMLVSLRSQWRNLWGGNFSSYLSVQNAYIKEGCGGLSLIQTSTKSA